MLKFQSTCCHGTKKTQEEFESRDSSHVPHQKNRTKTVDMKKGQNSHTLPRPPPPQASNIQFEHKEWITKSPGSCVW